MKQIYNLRTIITLIVLATAFNLQAGNRGLSWTKDLPSTVSWQKVTPLGQLIASGPNGLMSIAPASGEILWSAADLTGVQEASFRPIENSPFMIVEPENGANFCILDAQSGKVVFNAKKVGLEKVNDYHFLYASGKILVIGTSGGGKNTEMVMVDMADGRKLWLKSGAFTFTTAVKDLGKDEVLLLSAFFAAKINATTGEEIWKQPIDPAMAKMAGFMKSLEAFVAQNVSRDELMTQLITTSHLPGGFIMAGQSKKSTVKTDAKGNKTTVVTYSAIFMAFDLATGAHKWPAVVEMNYPLGISIPCADGLIISSSADGKLNMLSYADGAAKLGKKGNGLSLKGPASGAIQLKDGRMIVISSNGDNSFVSALDTKTGLLSFEKAAKIGGVVGYAELLPRGVLIGTNEEVNYLNTATGEWYLEDGIPGGSGCIATGSKDVFVFNAKSGVLQRMELDGTSFAAVNTVPVEFKGKERASGLELLPEGVVVKSDQNLALIDYSGTVKFQKYIEAPGVSGLKKALLIASAVRAAYYSAAFATYSAAFGSAAQQIQVRDAQSAATRDLAANLSAGFGEVSATAASYTKSFIQKAGERFKATTETPDYNLILAAGEKGTASLLQVSKKTGEVLSTIPLGKDKNPIYDVDMVDGRLYYMKDGDTMECHVF